MQESSMDKQSFVIVVYAFSILIFFFWVRTGEYHDTCFCLQTNHNALMLRSCKFIGLCLLQIRFSRLVGRYSIRYSCPTAYSEFCAAESNAVCSNVSFFPDSKGNLKAKSGRYNFLRQSKERKGFHARNMRTEEIDLL
ncbi:hypothetical protein KP509_16G048400 [Ceratopteris richardii]|uniref:Uncharacterized protein n=1 Tax=Ceratopteris richardii TaxID=49495 RepID=A0A8T2SZF0_CERRI|nr:hypothetical protein KP509_16G048400 [Ceratopteris richardii]